MRHVLVAVATALCLTTALAPASLAEDPAAPLMVEIQPNPEGDDAGAEWVEFANPTPAPLDLDGFELTDHDSCFASGEGFTEDYHWELSGTIPAQGHLVLTLPEDCLNLRNGEAGDDLELVREGQTLQRVAYGDEGPLDVPGEAETLSACHVDANLHGEWSIADASPGASNPDCDLSVDTVSMNL